MRPPSLPLPLSLLLVIIPCALLILPLLYPPWLLSPKAQGCRMSWMSPSYRHIPVTNVTKDLGERYRLWLYREVGWDNDDTPDGLPLLFLPGNSGSFKQSRSLASSLSRQFYTSPFVRSPDFPPSSRPIDLYALDTAEELSAFSAEPLLAQAQYAAAAIPQILALYAHQPSPPTQVVLVAHSMGGLVARLLLPLLPPGTVKTVIALSTPHAFPPLPISRALEGVYKPQPLPEGVLFLTLCGGTQDTEFPSELCGAWAPPSAPLLPGQEAAPEAGVAITRWTTATEGIWTGVGHREVVWCHQVRWRVARLVLELQELSSLEKRREGVERWFGEFAPLRARLEEGDGGGEVERGRLRVLGEGTEGGRGVVYPMTKAVVLYLCPASPTTDDHDAPCRPAEVKRRKLLPAPPSGEPWPRPGEGAGEEEGVVLEQFELGQGEKLGVLERPGVGWVAAGKVGEVITSDVTFLQVVLFGLSLPLPTAAQTALHSRILLPNLPTHALLVYSARLTTSGSCSLLPPMLSTPEEGHYHPLASLQAGYFPSHSSGPFLPPVNTPLQFDIHAAGPSPTSAQPCSVQSLHLRLSLRASLARALPRYRVLLAAWSASISLLLSLLSLSLWDSGQPFPSLPQAYSHYLRLVFLPLALALWGLAMLPLPHELLIGTSGLWPVSVLAPLLLAGGTLLVGVSVGVVWMLVWFLAGLMWLVGLRGKGSTNGTTRTGGPTRLRALVRTYLPLLLISLLLILFVPAQFVLLAAFLFQLLTCARSRSALFPTPSRDKRPSTSPTPSRPSEPAPTRRALQETHLAQASHLLLVLLWLLPLSLPSALTWVVHLPSPGPRLLPSSERDPLAVLCALVALSHASEGRVWARARNAWERLGSAALLGGLVLYAFVWGGRWTYGVYEGVEWYFLAGLLRPAASDAQTQAEGERAGSMGTKE